MDPPKPSPISTDPVTVLSATHRRVFCHFYEHCLDVAVLEAWQNFSCDFCDAYEPVEHEPRWWIAEGLRCEALLLCACYPKLRDIAPPAVIFRALASLAEGDKDGEG